MTPWRAPNIVFLFAVSVIVLLFGIGLYFAWPSGGDLVMRDRVTGVLVLPGVEMTVYTGVGLVVQKVKW